MERSCERTLGAAGGALSCGLRVCLVRSGAAVSGSLSRVPELRPRDRAQPSCRGSVCRTVCALCAAGFHWEVLVCGQLAAGFGTELTETDVLGLDVVCL